MEAHWTMHEFSQSISTSLCRIRNKELENYFYRLDLSRSRFIPKERLAFVYPNDDGHDDEAHVIDKDDANAVLREKLAKQIVETIELVAKKLSDDLLNETSKHEFSETSPVTALHSRLKLLSSDHQLVEPKDQLNTDANEPDRAMHHLQQLHSINIDVSETMWKRRLSIEHSHRIRFQVGDLVHHKKFGFRGVVVGWDPFPVIDVSRWDGLQQIENPKDWPFYHVIPDKDDCRETFGGERLSRYVCEENLLPCPPERSSLNVDLDAEWVLMSKMRMYRAPEGIRVSAMCKCGGLYHFLAQPCS